MKKTVLILTVIAFAFATILTGCGDKEKEKSSNKQILGFSITTPDRKSVV